jgi:hypothetical protein
MKPTCKTYEIKTVNDFLQIPENRLSACLKEFKIAISFGIACRDLQKIMDKDAPFNFPYFKWIDDGKKTAKIKFEELVK